MAQSETRPTGRAYRLYILLLLLALNALSYADRHVFSVLIPAIKKEFGATDALIGIMGGPGFIISYVMFSLPMARWADRWSRRGVLTAAAALWSAATAACGAAANVAQLATARLIVGVGEAGGTPPSQSMLSDLYEESDRSGAMGVLSSAAYIGVLLGLAGGAAIASLWGWRATFFSLALPGFPLALLMWLTGPRRKGTVSNAPARPNEGIWIAVRRFWAIPSLRVLAIGVGTFNIFGYAAAIWTPAFFMRSHGMSMIEAGSWLGIGSAIGGITGSMASGFVADHMRAYGESWQLRVPAIAFFIAFPVSLISYSLPGGAQVSVGAFHIPGVALLTIFSSMMSAMWGGPAFGAAARLVSPHQRAQAIAMLVVLVNVIGSGFGPVIGGFVSDGLTGSFGTEALRISLMSMSILTALGGGLCWCAAGHYSADLSRQAEGAGRSFHDIPARSA